jgi:hypothetical protein
MKTILMNIFDSNMVRNILRTDVLKTLVADPEVGKIVLLVHPVKLEEYTKEFASDKVILDIYPSNLPSKAELLTWFLVRHTIHTRNVRAKINELYYTGGGNWFMRTGKFLSAFLAFYGSYFPPINWLIRAVTKAFHDSEMFDPLMEKYKPDLVFMPTIFATNDIRLLKYCVDHKIPNVGMIKSWDNLIGKDPLLLWPDRLVVHNQFVEGYATRMHHYPKEHIYIAGIPQMDVYADPNFVLSREEFFNRNGLDINKKLIVYAAVGRLISYHEPEIIKYLAELVRDTKFADPVQLLVRLHPAYPSDDEKIQGIPGITVVRPGKLGAERNPLRFDFEFQESETRELASTLKWADVVIQSGSTMAIDAACFDAPIISMGFDGYIEDEIQERSTRRLLVKDHFKLILNTGGTKAVYSSKELVETINAYLQNPELDREGRMRIVAEQCYKLDGQAGKRIGNYVLERLHSIQK